MIKHDQSFSRENDLKGYKSNLKGSQQQNLEEILKQSLLDFRYRYDSTTVSDRDKLTEQKINYIVQKLKETIQKIEDGTLEDIDTENLTQSEKSEIAKSLESALTGLSEKLKTEISNVLEKAIKDYVKQLQSQKDSNIKTKVVLKGEIETDYLLEYFDKINKNDENWKQLRTDIHNTLAEQTNQTLSLFRERMQQYKDYIAKQSKDKSVANKRIQKLNSLVGKSKREKEIEQKEKESNDVVQNDILKNDKKQQDSYEKNLLKDNLITQQILDVVRKNEGKEVDKKNTKLTPYHIDMGKNLVDKFYKNGKFELKLKKLKGFFGLTGKILKGIFLPITFGVKKLFGMTKFVLKKLAILSAAVFTKGMNFFLLTPTVLWTLGFVSGIICRFIYDYIVPEWVKKLLHLKPYENEQDKERGFLGNINEFLIQPIFELSKKIIGGVLNIIEFIAKHHKLIITAGTILYSLWQVFKHWGVIKPAFSLVSKGGFAALGGMLVGMGASAAMSFILNKTIFKRESDTEQKLEFGKGKHKDYASLESRMDTTTVSRLTGQSATEYSDLKNKMDAEDSELEMITDHLELVLKSYSGSKEKEKYSLKQILGDNFLDRIYNSELFGENINGKNKFEQEYGNKPVNEQINALMTEVNTRYNMLNNMQYQVVESSNRGSVALLQSVDEIKNRISSGGIGDFRKQNQYVDPSLDHKFTNWLYDFQWTKKLIKAGANLDNAVFGEKAANSIYSENIRQDIKLDDIQSGSEEQRLNKAFDDLKFDSSIKQDDVHKLRETAKQTYADFLKDNPILGKDFAYVAKGFLKDVKLDGQSPDSLRKQLNEYFKKQKDEYLKRLIKETNKTLREIDEETLIRRGLLERKKNKKEELEKLKLEYQRMFENVGNNK